MQHFRDRAALFSEPDAVLEAQDVVVPGRIGQRLAVTNVDGVPIAEDHAAGSDGLHGYLRDEEIAVITELGTEPAVHRLIELANERGGKDNITAILVEIS